MNTRLLLSIVALWSLSSLPAQAGLNEWTLTGPEGGRIESLAVHPTTRTIVLAGAYSGIHRSTDGGLTWTRISTPVIRAKQIAFDPSDPERVFARDNSTIYRSTDRGATFKALSKPCCIDIDAQAVAGDGTVYVGDRTGALFRSTDHGDHWTAVPIGWALQASLGSANIFVDPANPSVVFFALSSLGVFKSTDAGAQWSAAISTAPSGATVVHQFAVRPGDSTRMVAATDNGLYVSSDAGATWTQHLPGVDYYAVAFDPAAPDKAATIALGGMIIRSNDAGITWPVTGSETVLHVNHAYALLFDPVSSSKMFVATSDGPMISTDSGATFELRVSGLHGEAVNDFEVTADGNLLGAFYGPLGIFRYGASGWTPLAGNPELRLVGATPFLSSFALAGPTGAVMYALQPAGNLLVKSTNGGANWSAPNAQLQGSGTTLQRVVTDPNDPAIAYVLTSNAGLWKTVNAGTTWIHLTTGLPDSVISLAVEPGDSSVVYASGVSSNTRFVLKSLDAGVTWSTIKNGLDDSVVQQFVFDPSNAQTVYVLQTARVSKSIDGGATWTPFVNDGRFVRSLSLDPVRPTTMIVTPTSALPSDGFAWTVDDGATWENVPWVAETGAGVSIAAVDPQRPSKVLLNGFGTGIYEFEVAPDLDVSLLGLDEPLPVSSTMTARVRARNGSQLSSSASLLTVALPAFLDTSVPSGCARAGGPGARTGGRCEHEGRRQDVSIHHDGA